LADGARSGPHAGSSVADSETINRFAFTGLPPSVQQKEQEALAGPSDLAYNRRRVHLPMNRESPPDHLTITSRNSLPLNSFTAWS
jgi:hypothetical protein